MASLSNSKTALPSLKCLPIAKLLVERVRNDGSTFAPATSIASLSSAAAPSFCAYIARA